MVLVGQNLKCANCGHVFDAEQDTDTYGAWQCNSCGLWHKKEMKDDEKQITLDSFPRGISNANK